MMSTLPINHEAINVEINLQEDVAWEEEGNDHAIGPCEEREKQLVERPLPRVEILFDPVEIAACNSHIDHVFRQKTDHGEEEKTSSDKRCAISPANSQDSKPSEASFFSNFLNPDAPDLSPNCDETSIAFMQLFPSPNASPIADANSSCRKGQNESDSDGPPIPSEEDDTSVISSAYFVSSDFVPKHWSKALTQNEVMIGLAVVAITFGLTHPILFAVGALTAVGTATAVGAVYDAIMEGPLAACCAGAEQVEPTVGVFEDEELTMALGNGGTQKDAAQDTAADASKNALVASSVVSTAPMTASEPQTVASYASTAATLTAAVEDLPEKLHELHYPKLSKVIIDVKDNAVFQGLNVLQVFNVFFSDEAPYNFREFQRKRGDKDILYGTWKDVKVADNEQQPLSMHPDADRPFTPEDVANIEMYQTRVLKFQAKTNNAFFGPPYASTTKVQRICMVNKKFGILEQKTTLADIPFCDRFFVMDRWLIRADKDDCGNYHCHITTSAQVFFVKSCPLATQIKTKSYASVRDVATAWYVMSIEALKLAEQERLERIRRREQQDDEDPTQRLEDNSAFLFQEEKKESFDEVDAHANRQLETNTKKVNTFPLPSPVELASPSNMRCRTASETAIEVMRSSGDARFCVLGDEDNRDDQACGDDNTLENGALSHAMIDDVPRKNRPITRRPSLMGLSKSLSTRMERWRRSNSLDTDLEPPSAGLEELRQLRAPRLPPP